MTTKISDITVKTIKGEDKQLNEYTGKVLLIVNVASYCGYTPQYEGLVPQGGSQKSKVKSQKVHTSRLVTV